MGVTRLVGIYLIALAPVAFVLWMAGAALQAPAEAQANWFMSARAFNEIAAKVGCKPDAVNSELVEYAAERVASCLQGRLLLIEGRLKALEARKKP